MDLLNSGARPVVRFELRSDALEYEHEGEKENCVLQSLVNSKYIFIDATCLA